MPLKKSQIPYNRLIANLYSPQVMILYLKWMHNLILKFKQTDIYLKNMIDNENFMYLALKLKYL